MPEGVSVQRLHELAVAEQKKAEDQFFEIQHQIGAVRALQEMLSARSSKAYLALEKANAKLSDAKKALGEREQVPGSNNDDSAASSSGEII